MMSASAMDAARRVSPLITMLRCLECAAPVVLTSLAATPGYPELGPDGELTCERCGERYPLIGGTARMLPRALRRDLASEYPLARGAFSDEEYEAGREAPATDSDALIKRRTAESFAYEWSHFGKLRDEWRKNFLDYMQPLEERWFPDRYVLDIGAGSGRHSFHAAMCGAHVVAVDIGASIDVARGNLPSDALTIQADAERLPLESGGFDLVMSIGVLHHLPDPDRALSRLARLARPGGHIHLYLYWVPERVGHERALRAVTAARRITVRLPHWLLHALCVPLAGALMGAVVGPYRLLRWRPRGRRIAAAFPLKTYADYPFAVLLNDQFDRFSAPLERRYTRLEVESMLRKLGLEDVRVTPNHGWVADGIVPGAGAHLDTRRTAAATEAWRGEK
jgi:ubiquinone/menaquinone biosynthesis C-methylase UbiE/uncharacterized protein YbaR (Trm112 family)